MKKILVVDDKNENLEAAKAFFSTIFGFEFIYCTNRKDAEKLILEVDAVITDRSMPYDENNYYNVIPSEIPDYTIDHNLNFFSEVNGDYIFCKVVTLGKPVVMISGHGEDDLQIGLFDSKRYTIPVDLLEANAENPSWFICEKFFSYTHSGGGGGYAFEVLPHGQISKRETVSWKKAWNALIEQF